MNRIVVSGDRKISCIIPFWNEGSNLIPVLDEISKSRYISEIICVDDGSRDCNFFVIQEYYSHISLVRNEVNLGKSEAVREGLRHASYDNIMLLDADLRNLDHREIDRAAMAFMGSDDIDMLILRRINAVFFVKLYRADILFTGERILRKSDLETILDSSDVCGWQLESAINTWMYNNNKKVCWVPHSAINKHKYLKHGVINGLRLDLRTYSDMVSAAGFNNFMKQILFFAKEELKVEVHEEEPVPHEEEVF